MTFPVTRIWFRYRNKESYFTPYEGDRPKIFRTLKSLRPGQEVTMYYHDGYWEDNPDLVFSTYAITFDQPVLENGVWRDFQNRTSSNNTKTTTTTTTTPWQERDREREQLWAKRERDHAEFQRRFDAKLTEIRKTQRETEKNLKSIRETLNRLNSLYDDLEK